ncbi:MAG TPA: hypothetical protein VK508_09180 [Cyclobacteriaceae bacterium]|nr:hypothetical protein [Cyclobacteriaceae bacterium]
MILKIFRVLWFFSILAVLGFFMYVYASLPDPVVVMEEPEQFVVSKETLFYIILATLAVFNMFVYVFRSLNKTEEGEGFVSWYYGLVICLNAFFIVAVSYISLFNSGERFAYERIGIIIYGSVALMILWAFSWPVYLAGRKIFAKKAV